MDLHADRDQLLARVASLYYEDAQTQQEISLKLGYSRSSISRMLTEARQEGIVEIHVHHHLERNASLDQRLQCGFNLCEVQVLQDNGLPYPQMLRRLGGLAAKLLVQSINEHSILGISWGTALYEVANALQSMPTPGAKVVQLIGSGTSGERQVAGPG